MSAEVTILDLPTSLAAVSRWHDMGRRNIEVSLGSLLKGALRENAFSALNAVGLFPLLNSASKDLIGIVVNDLVDVTSVDLGARAVELIAKDELARFGPRAEILETINRNAPEGMKNGPWLGQLAATVEFIASNQIVPRSSQDRHPVAQRNDAWSTGSFKGSRFVATDEICRALAELFGDSGSSGEVLPRDACLGILAAIRDEVRIGDWVAHLNALSAVRSAEVNNSWIMDAVLACLSKWDSPAVRIWCETSLGAVIVDRLPGTVPWPSHSADSTLRRLLSFLPTPNESVPRIISEAISRHVDQLGASEVYGLLMVLAEWMNESEVGEAVLGYLPRLVMKISPSDASRIELQDVPSEVSTATARFLFSMMSDVDVRVRWRAAHSVRRLAVLGSIETVDALFATYSRIQEGTFREPGMPFYWLAARLWFLAAADRIVHEAPHAISKHGKELLEIAFDEAFPHLLITGFAKNAAKGLSDLGVFHLDPQQQTRISMSNMGQFGPRRSIPNWDSRAQGIAKRTYQFDLLDTVPYWYEPRLNLFSDVTLEEFLDCAEKWIIQTWNAPHDLSRWNREPRQLRFSRDERGLSYASHGSEPTLERYSTYLEWHAMFCATGELLRTRLLAKPDDPQDRTLQSWLSERQVAFPPYWLADLRCPKPLIHRFWDAPSGDLEVWERSMSSADFFVELFPTEHSAVVAVRVQLETGSAAFDSECEISTALVWPETASSLMRAFDTTVDPWDYKLPEEDEEFSEIDNAPYQLRGWLSVDHGDSGFDQKDPLRNSVDCPPYRPGRSSISTLSRSVLWDGRVAWSRNDGQVEFESQSWSDRRNDLPEEKVGSGITSEGVRLLTYRDALRRRLRDSGFDLIAKVTLTRRIRLSGRREYEADGTTKQVRRAKVFLLRQGGDIEAVEGRIGTW